MLNSFLRNVIE